MMDNLQYYKRIIFKNLLYVHARIEANLEFIAVLYHQPSVYDKDKKLIIHLLDFPVDNLIRIILSDQNWFAQSSSAIGWKYLMTGYYHKLCRTHIPCYHGPIDTRS